MRARILRLVLLLLIPAAAAAQVTTGTSPAGLYYEASGAGDPVVLIHAFSVDRRMWAPQIAALETRFRVIRYDLRGHGKSAAPSEPYAAHEDLLSVLDAVGVSRATLIGLSAGSTLAIDFALAHPDRRAVVRSQILVVFPHTPDGVHGKREQEQRPQRQSQRTAVQLAGETAALDGPRGVRVDALLLLDFVTLSRALG